MDTEMLSTFYVYGVLPNELIHYTLMSTSCELSPIYSSITK